MATAEIDPVPAPALPDYLSDPNAVLKDPSKWRYGKAPDYSKTRTVFEQSGRLPPIYLVAWTLIFALSS